MTTAYTPAIDIERLVALDVHVHAEIDAHGHRSLDDELMDASMAYFRSPSGRTPSLDQIAQHYRERQMAAVVFTVDATTSTGHPAIASEEVALAAAEHNDVLVPFGSVDPWGGIEAVARACGLIDEYGVRGMKFHPTLQAFAPNDRTFYPLYEALQQRGVVALFHTGQTGIGAGLPGGRGLKLRYSDPMLVDDVAADFPDLAIVLAHPAVPWVESGMSIVTHKSNVHMDLSGWSPKYFPATLVRQLGNVLTDKVMFGSDFPLITPDRWLKDFAALGVPQDKHSRILKHNAIRLLGL